MPTLTALFAYALCIILPLAALTHGKRGAHTLTIAVVLVYHIGSAMLQSAGNLNNIIPLFGMLGAYALARRFEVARGVLMQAAAVLSLVAVVTVRSDWFNGANAIGAIMAMVCALGPSPVHVIGLMFTLSRGAWASVITYMRLPLLLVLVCVGVLGVLRWETVTDRVNTQSEAVWQWSRSPWVGHGSGAFPVLNRGKEHADNMPITVAVEGGLLGLAVYAWAAWRLWRSPELRPLLGAVAVHGLLDYPLFWPLPSIFFGGILAVLEKGGLGIEN